MTNEAWYVRVGLLSACVMAELIGLSVLYDFDSLSDTGAAWARAFSYTHQVLMAVLVGIATLGLILAPRLRAITRTLASGYGDHRWPFNLGFGLHLFSFAGLAALTPWIVEQATEPFGLIVLAWFLLGIGVILAWLLALAPARRWWDLLRDEWPTALLAAMVGMATLAAGIWAHALWDPLARATLETSRLLLGLVYPVVEAIPDEGILGAGGFKIAITEECSGYEGIALIVVFLALYLIQFRRELRLPQALFVIPLGVTLMWLFNALRLAILITIGASWSSEIALGGFHSQAGWISFILVSLGLILLAHRTRLFARRPNTIGLDKMPAAGHQPRYGQFATALLLPWLVLMALVIGSAALTQGIDWLYPVRVIAVAGILWIFRDIYREWSWGWSWLSVGLGAMVYMLWLLLVSPTAGTESTLVANLAALPPWMVIVWTVFRVLGSVVTVPLAEELAFRGYLLGKLADPKFGEAPFTDYHWLSFLGSSLAFGVLHESWIAGTLAGMAYALALYHRGRIMDAVTAHMTTNGLIAITVLTTGQWGRWT